MLKIDDKAPDFSLINSDMDLQSLEDFAGQWLVLYFFPKDNTPSAITLATDFTEFESEFDELSTRIVGVSPDECFVHQKFIEEHGITFPLLADPEREACGDYGVMQDIDGAGIKLLRSTFIIDAEGVLRHVQYGVNPEGHVRSVLKQVELLRKR